MTTHPVDDLLRSFPDLDFAVLEHGFAPHGRDYTVIAQYGGVRDPGTYQLEFTHCVKAEIETRVSGGAWPASWRDEFTNYDRWLAAGSPDGYVWGTNWSLAYPGLVPGHGLDAAPRAADA